MSEGGGTHETYPDPFGCPHMTGARVGGHHECTYAGRPVWVDCRTPFCGEPPACRFAPLDNSSEAMARRVAWAAGRAEQTGRDN